MENNIPQEDLQHLCDFIIENPILTNSGKVREFERCWGDWLGTKYSVYVNSGGSANLVALLVLRHKLLDAGVDENDLGEVIVSSVNWVTDISSVMLCGFKPVFVDVDLRTLSMDPQKVIGKMGENTRAVLLTHLMGFDALSDDLLDACKERDVALLEDCCESHGASHNGKRVGSYGDMSMFSFYYGHHVTTIEGGMVCTNDKKVYEMLRMFRSHGLVRESTDPGLREEYYLENPEPSPEFVFAYPGFNFRGNEIGAVLGLRQMNYLDGNIEIRRRNYDLFLRLLDGERFITDFKVEGNSNFGLVVLLKDKDDGLMERLVESLRENNVVYRRGVAGGGNQLRQPYLKKRQSGNPEDFPNADHIHFYGLYIGNHQLIKESDIKSICEVLNNA